MDEPLYWFELRGAHRRQWSVLLSTPRLTPDLRSSRSRWGCLGATVYDEASVYINATYSNRDIWEATIHELGHVALERAGFEFEEEERFVAAIEPGLACFLAQLGLVMPALPDGLDAMRRRARRLAK